LKLARIHFSRSQQIGHPHRRRLVICYPRFAHDKASTRNEHARNFAQSGEWAFDVMQHIDHNNIGKRSIGKVKALRVTNCIKPGRETISVEIEEGACSLKFPEPPPTSSTRPGLLFFEQVPIDVRINGPQRWFAIPDFTALGRSAQGAFQRHLHALNFRKAKVTIRHTSRTEIAKLFRERGRIWPFRYGLAPVSLA